MRPSPTAMRGADIADAVALHAPLDRIERAAEPGG
jgi:hypothetical protein